MEIYCKSAINNQELLARNLLLKDGIEIQLLGDFLLKDKKYIQLTYKNIANIENIKLVHSPLFEGRERDAINIEELFIPEVYKVFDNTCYLAEKIGEYNKRDIIVIIHTGIAADDLRLRIESYNIIKKIISKALLNYPYIKIAIENVMPIYGLDNFSFRNGALPDYIEIINKLRKDINTNRIGAVFDTCHAISTIRFFNKIFKNEDSFHKDLNLDSYLKLFSDNLFLIHLSDVKGLGYTHDSHGITFDSNSKNLLQKIMDKYYFYNLQCPITIEVSESDYGNCVNYTQTRNMLEVYWNGNQKMA